MRCFFVSVLVYLFLQSAIMGADASRAEEPAWDRLSFVIDDSRCFVGVVPVYLTVSELRREGDNLVGTYRINVPLKKSKNDFGRIVLPIDASSVGELGEKGGTLTGKAHSELEEGITNTIVCEILPEKNQTIKLAITTKHRTVNFKSKYTVIESSEAEIDS